MSISSYLKLNISLLILSFIIGAGLFYLADELRYLKFQLVYSLLFSFISMIIFFGINYQNDNNKDIKAIGISMMQSLGKLVLSLVVLIPLYMMYCPIDNYYLLNFIITYILYMILDTYVLSRA